MRRKGWIRGSWGSLYLGRPFESESNHIMDIMAANDCACKAFFIWMSIEKRTHTVARIGLLQTMPPPHSTFFFYKIKMQVQTKLTLD